MAKTVTIQGKTAADNVSIKLAYCDVCSPKVAIGWGAIPTTIAPKHVVNGKVHDAKLLEVSANEPMNPGELPVDFLSRMLKKYVTK